MAALFVEFTLYDLGVLSDHGLTLAVKITAYSEIPLFVLHNLKINREKKRNDATRSPEATAN